MRNFLIKNNIPYDVAMNLDTVMLSAHFITMGNFERPRDGQWNFKEWRWNNPQE